MNKGKDNQEFKPLMRTELKNVRPVMAINTSFHVNLKVPEKIVYLFFKTENIFMGFISLCKCWQGE